MYTTPAAGLASKIYGKVSDFPIDLTRPVFVYKTPIKSWLDYRKAVLMHDPPPVLDND